MAARLLMTLLLASAVLAHAAASASAQGRGLRLGFLDEVFTEPAPQRDAWLDRAVASGSDVVRLPTGWGGIAPRQPAAPRDPSDPAYAWGSLDDAVRAASARGQSVILG